MTAAYYDFFRKIILQPDGITLEADGIDDTLTITSGAGVALNPNASTDSFTIDVDYQLYVPIGTTEIRLNDVNSNYSGVAITAGSNITIGRNNDNEITITSTVGGLSKAISGISQTSPAVVTTTNPHEFTEGIAVTITDVNGMTEVNGNEYYMDILTGSTFALYEDSNLTTPLNSTGFTLYSSGGVATAEYAAPQSLTQLNDVDLISTPPVTGNFLQYNGTFWGTGTSLAGDLTGDVVGSVFADNSTLLVDAVNGIIPKANIQDSVNWDSAFSWGNHTAFGYLTSAPNSLDDVLTLGNNSALGIDVGASTISGITLTGTVIDTTDSSPLTITPAAIFSSDVTVENDLNANNLIISGVTTLQQSTEVLNTKTAATGTVIHDFSTGSIFYHSSISADFTANFTNVPTTDNRTISVVLILSQGATAFIPTAVQIDSAAQTVQWQGGTPPAGTVNGIDIISFTFIRIASSWLVLGSGTSYL